MTPEVLAHSVARACRVIDCGRTKIYEMMSKGQIRAKKLGNKTIIPHSELVRLLDSLPDADFGKPAEDSAPKDEPAKAAP